MTGDFDDFMGGGGRTVQFETPGDTVRGQVLAPPERRQQTDPNTGEPKTFPDGRPKYIFCVRLQTDLRDPQDPFDDGERMIYLKWKSLIAVRNAIRAVGGNGLEVGGYLTLTLVGFGPKTKAAWNA